MYSPPYHRLEERAELMAFMRANSVALRVNGTGGALQRALAALARKHLVP